MFLSELVALASFVLILGEKKIRKNAGIQNAEHALASLELLLLPVPVLLL